MRAMEKQRCQVVWKWNREGKIRFTQSTKRHDKSKIHNEHRRWIHTHITYRLSTHSCTHTHSRCMSLVCSTDTHNLVVELSARIQYHRKIHYIRSRIHHITSLRITLHCAPCYGYWKCSWKRKIIVWPASAAPIHQQQQRPPYLELLWTWNLCAQPEAAKMNAKEKRKFPPLANRTLFFFSALFDFVVCQLLLFRSFLNTRPKKSSSELHVI